MTAPVAFGPACHGCRRRGVLMRWYTPIAPSAPARCYCRRRACQAARRRWTDGSFAYTMEPVRGARAPLSGIGAMREPPA